MIIKSTYFPSVGPPDKLSDDINIDKLAGANKPSDDSIPPDNNEQSDETNMPEINSAVGGPGSDANAQESVDMQDTKSPPDAVEELSPPETDQQTGEEDIKNDDSNASVNDVEPLAINGDPSPDNTETGNAETKDPAKEEVDSEAAGAVKPAAKKSNLLRYVDLINATSKVASPVMFNVSVSMKTKYAGYCKL